MDAQLRDILGCMLALVCGGQGAWAQQDPYVTAARPGRSAYSLQVEAPREVSASITYTYTYPNFQIDEFWAFLAKPPVMPQRQQLEERVSVPGFGPVRTKVAEQGGLQRTLLVARGFPSSPIQQFQLEVTYTGTLTPSHLLRGATARPVPPLDPREHDAYLTLDRELNFGTPAFQEYLRAHDLVLREGEDPVVFAAKVYHHIGQHFTYDAVGPAVGTLTNLMQCARGNCGHCSQFFVGVCRANRIPARTLFGRWATSGPAGDPGGQCHTMAEFWVEGTGWVPVDPTAAIASKGSDYTALGRFNGDFLTFHIGIDLHCRVDQAGASRENTFSILQLPAVFVWGHTGTLDGATTTGTWKVTRGSVAH